MLFNLTILERMILECLQQNTQTLESLSEKTKLEDQILQKNLQSLIVKNLVIQKGRALRINRQLNQQIMNELNDTTNLMCEVHEIINSCLRKVFDKSEEDTNFKLKKVNMTEREEKIYKGLKYNLEAFLASLDKSDEIAKQKIIFWGEGNYENIKNSIINF